MNPAVLATVFALIFVAELPDKTALASLVLGTRYKPAYVFAGTAAAFTVHVGLATAAGSLLTLLPHRVLEAVIGVLFLAGAVLLRGRHGGEEENLAIAAGTAPTFTGVADTSFPGDPGRRIRRPDPDRHRQPGGEVPRPAQRRARRRPGTVAVAGWRSPGAAPCSRSSRSP